MSFVENAKVKISSFTLFLQNKVSELESTGMPDPDLPTTMLTIESRTSDIVRELCLSLLSGEYIQSDILNILNSCIVEVRDYPRYADTLSNEAMARVLDLSNTVDIIIEAYKILINEIVEKYTEDGGIYLFSQYTIFEDILIKSVLSKEYEKFVNYFNVLLELVRIENFPSTNKDYIVGIFDCEKKLNRYKINDFLDISLAVYTKIKFLKHKWKKRIENINPYHYNYLDSGTLKSIEDFSEDNKKLKDWVSIIDTQYDIIVSNCDDIIKRRVKEYINEDLNSLEILQIHQLIKYYKDIRPNLNKLEEISTYLSSIIKQRSNLNIFDSYAYNIICNYSLNNLFSLYLTKEDDISLVTSKFKEIKEKIRGSVNNYFLRFKYLEYVTKYLTQEITSDEKIHFIKSNETLIKDCKDEMESYKKDLDWAKLNSNYIFLLPFEESLVESKFPALDKIFYPSSFVLPPSFLKTEKDYERIKESYDNLILSYNTGIYFKNEIEKIEGLGKDLNAKDFKAIEIISIFTAIITFVLSSIPAYRFINTVWQSLLFMLSLATALSIFITLILFSTRDLYKKWYAYIPVLILSGLSFLGFLNLTKFEKEKMMIDKSLNKKLDSISKKKIDSLFIKKPPHKSKVAPTNSKTNGS